MRLRLNRLGHELTLSGEQILRVVAYSDLRLKPSGSGWIGTAAGYPIFVREPVASADTGALTPTWVLVMRPNGDIREGVLADRLDWSQDAD